MSLILGSERRRFSHEHWSHNDLEAKRARKISHSHYRETALTHTAQLKTAFEMWTRLTSQHLQCAAENKHLLQKQFFDYKYKPGIHKITILHPPLYNYGDTFFYPRSWYNESYHSRWVHGQHTQWLRCTSVGSSNYDKNNMYSPSQLPTLHIGLGQRGWSRQNHRSSHIKTP